MVYRGFSVFGSLNFFLFVIGILNGKFRPKKEYQAGIIHPQKHEHHRRSTAINRAGVGRTEIKPDEEFPKEKKHGGQHRAEIDRFPLKPHIGKEFENHSKKRGNKEKGNKKVQDLNHGMAQLGQQGSQIFTKRGQHRGNNERDQHQQSKHQYHPKGNGTVNQHPDKIYLFGHNTPNIVHRFFELEKHSRSAKKQKPKTKNQLYDGVARQKRIGDYVLDSHGHVRSDKFGYFLGNPALNGFPPKKIACARNRDDEQGRQGEKCVISNGGTLRPRLVFVPTGKGVFQQVPESFQFVYHGFVPVFLYENRDSGVSGQGINFFLAFDGEGSTEMGKTGFLKNHFNSPKMFSASSAL